MTLFALPSPQLIVTVCVCPGSGSVKVPLKIELPPSTAGVADKFETTGVTLEMFTVTATLTTATSEGTTRYAWFGGVHPPPAIGEIAKGLKSERLPLVTIGFVRSNRK